MHVLSQIKRILIFLPILVFVYAVYRYVEGSHVGYYIIFMGLSNDSERFTEFDYAVLMLPYLFLITVVESYLYIMNKRYMNFLFLRYGSPKRVLLKVGRDILFLSAFAELTDCLIYFFIGVGSHCPNLIYITMLLKILEKVSLGILLFAIDILFNRYLIGSILVGLIGFAFSSTQFIRTAHSIPILLICIVMIAVSTLICRFKKYVAIV
jgi:hypothetical protein